MLDSPNGTSSGNTVERSNPSSAGRSTPPRSPTMSPNSAISPEGCLSPLRVVQKDNLETVVTPPPVRLRLHSRDIPRCYSGLYGEGSEDLRPLELARHRGPWLQHKWLFLATYVVCLGLCQVFFAATWEDTPYMTSWTRTNGLHFAVTLFFLHWSKGSIYDQQGEMNAMTLWEQLEATQGTEFVKLFLKLVPTLVCYFACHFADFRLVPCLLNSALWFLTMIGKLSFMNDYRIFGINSTVGIDDFDFILSPSSSSVSLASETRKRQ